MRADLAQIAQAIPAWRSAGLSGMLSGRLVLSGPASSPAQLKGQGWLNAAGERLGDIPLLDRLFRGALGGVAERLGLSAMRRAQLTEIACQWRLANARIATEDLRLLGTMNDSEPVTLYVRGSVGLDRTLDFMIEPEFSEQLALQSPILGGLTRVSKLVSRHHLGGTIDKPEYKFEVTIQELLNQAIPFGLNQLLRPPESP